MTENDLTMNEKKAIAIFYRIKGCLIDPEIPDHKIWEVMMQMEALHTFGLSEDFMNKYIELDELKEFVSKTLEMVIKNVKEEEDGNE